MSLPKSISAGYNTEAMTVSPNLRAFSAAVHDFQGGVDVVNGANPDAAPEIGGPDSTSGLSL